MRPILSTVKNRLTTFSSAKKTTKILLILLAGTFLIFGFLLLSSMVCSKNSSLFCSRLAVLSNNSADQKTGQESNNSIFSSPGIIKTETGIWDGPKFISDEVPDSENMIYNGTIVSAELSKPSMTLTKNNVSAEILIDTNTPDFYYAPRSDSANYNNYPISSLEDLFLKLKDGDFVSYFPGKFIIVLY